MPQFYPTSFCSSSRLGTNSNLQEEDMTRTILVICCLLSAFLLACTQTETTTPTATTTPAQKASPAATTATSTVSTGDKIGVAECDDFIAAYEACVNNKVPEAARAQFNTGMAQWRKSWKTLAENPQTKPTLVQACKSSLESARTSMKAYGCTF
jgi:hypothetical protein